MTGGDVAAGQGLLANELAVSRFCLDGVCAFPQELSVDARRRPAPVSLVSADEQVAVTSEAAVTVGHIDLGVEAECPIGTPTIASTTRSNHLATYRLPTDLRS
jgi:hypothetical protein